MGGFLLFGKLLTWFYSEFFGTFCGFTMLNRKVLQNDRSFLQGKKCDNLWSLQTTRRYKQTKKKIGR